MVAGAAFAADFSGYVSNSGSLLDVTAAGGETTVTALTAPASPYFRLNASAGGEKFSVGIQTKFWGPSEANEAGKVAFNSYGVNVKPVDGWTIGYNTNSLSLHYNYIWWSGAAAWWGGNGGFYTSVNAGPVTVEAKAATGWGESLYDGEAFGDVVARVAYNGGDIGNVIGIFEYNNKAVNFGAGYDNTLGGQNFYVDVVGKYNEKFNTVAADAGVRGPITDSISYEVYVPFTVNVGESATADLLDTSLLANVAFGINDALDADVTVSVNDVIASSYGFGVSPELNVHCGALTLSLGADLSVSGLGDSTAVSFGIPLTISGGF